MATAITFVTSGGMPVAPTSTLGAPMTPVTSGGLAATVATLGAPVTLLDSSGLSLLQSATAYLGGIAPYHFWDFLSNRALYAGVDVGPVTSTPGWTISVGTLVMDSINGLNITNQMITVTAGLTYPLSVFAEFTRGVDSGAVETILQIDDGSTSNRILLAINASDLVVGQEVTGGASQGVVSAGAALSPSTTYKGAARFNTNSIQSVRSGTLGTEDTVGTLPAAPTLLRFGSQSGTTLKLGGYLRRVAVFNSALSDANLQTITA